jgi:hypothetical protein
LGCWRRDPYSPNCQYQSTSQVSLSFLIAFRPFFSSGSCHFYRSILQTVPAHSSSPLATTQIYWNLSHPLQSMKPSKNIYWWTRFLGRSLSMELTPALTKIASLTNCEGGRLSFSIIRRSCLHRKRTCIWSLRSLILCIQYMQFRGWFFIVKSLALTQLTLLRPLLDLHLKGDSDARLWFAF